MDFNKLMQTMRDLDRPVGESAVQECGDPMMNSMMPPMAPTTPHNPPTLTVNLNAQGMDDIESIMKLMTKVNPDMINQPMPKAAEIEPMGMPSLTPPGPSITPLSLGNLDSGPLKMLPDFDKGNDNMPGGEMDSPVDDIQKAMGDMDGDGDHDVKDHDLEKKDDGKEGDKAPNFKKSEEEDESVEPEDDDIMNHLNKELKPYDDQVAKDEEAKDESAGGFGDTDTTPDPEVKSVDYMNNQLAGGMNKPKQMTKHSYKQGDNPMAMEGSDLRASIRAELQQRLAEAKGAK